VSVTTTTNEGYKDMNQSANKTSSLSTSPGTVSSTDYNHAVDGILEFEFPLLLEDVAII